MGFYLRKSISVGPIRFNLSKSGVGVSAGVRGLRVGSGPRGNYVHMGRGGLYYRATLLSGSPSAQSVRPQPVQQAAPTIPPGTHEQLQEIDSVDATQISDIGSRELLAELDAKSKRGRLLPWVIGAGAIALFFGAQAAWPPWAFLLTLALTAVAAYAAHTWDALAKTVVVFYELDATCEVLYTRLHAAGTALATASSLWHIDASGKVHDRKYHAGATNLIRRNSTSFRKVEPPYVKTNIETLSVKVGKQTLHFFPDRVLIYDSKGVGAVSYKTLSATASHGRFIEDGAVPRDAKVVDQTWRYVNKKGGPDRRFKDNRKIPVCLYEELSLSSSTGLNELLQVSKCGPAAAFAEAIGQLARSLPGEGRPSAP